MLQQPLHEIEVAHRVLHQVRFLSNLYHNPKNLPVDRNKSQEEIIEEFNFSVGNISTENQ